jgi:phosphoribosyl 1,2-cyclic phosphodiesterase
VQAENGVGGRAGERRGGMLTAMSDSSRMEAVGGGARMCVLASGSSGNCTVLAFGSGARARLVLIDAGLSPRQTALRLGKLGFHLRQVTDVLLTHLDRDHCAPAWSQAMLQRATLRIHKRHLSRARRQRLLYHTRTELFGDEPFRLPNVGTVHARLMDHDDLGVAAFRVSIEDRDGAHDLGFATDLGRVRDDLIEHLYGVETLAIESNYDPEMQRRSGRPAFLQRRITGGAGHLSNAECASAVRAIGPTEHVVLLHLSRQCNTRELAAAGHRGAAYRVTVSTQHEATGWVELAPRRREAAPRVKTVARRGAMAQMGLFEVAAGSWGLPFSSGRSD